MVATVEATTGAVPGEAPSLEVQGDRAAAVAAVREGRPPLVDGTEARKALAVVEAMYRSAATGGWVPVAAGPPARPAP